MNLDRRQVIFFGALTLLVVGIAAIFLFGRRAPSETPGKKITLTFWGVFDEDRDFNALVKSFKESYSNVSIQYFQKPADTYESELINALAAGKGPDVFMIHSSWLPKHYEKLYPASSKRLTVAQLEQLFPRVVRSDFAPGDTIYALPLYIDTLALYINRDLFDEAGIAVTPKSWEGFTNAVNRLKSIDESTGRIKRAGAAFGGSPDSVNRAGDIVSLLMMQNGALMVTPERSGAALNQRTSSNLGIANPGEEGLEFYTKFSNPLDPDYTWTDSFGNSIDAFADGNAAMMINYQHQVQILQEKNAFLNFEIVPVPQREADSPVNVASYWGIAVGAKAIDPAAAWNFVTHITTKPQVARLYTEATERPPALRSLIAENERDRILSVFTKQSLTARSWPQPDNIEIDEIFSDMIGSVVSGRSTPSDAVRKANSEISNLIKKMPSYKIL